MTRHVQDLEVDNVYCYYYLYMVQCRMYFLGGLYQEWQPKPINDNTRMLTDDHHRLCLLNSSQEMTRVV